MNSRVLLRSHSFSQCVRVIYRGSVYNPQPQLIYMLQIDNAVEVRQTKSLFQGCTQSARPGLRLCFCFCRQVCVRFMSGCYNTPSALQTCSQTRFCDSIPDLALWAGHLPGVLRGRSLPRDPTPCDGSGLEGSGPLAPARGGVGRGGFRSGRGDFVHGGVGEASPLPLPRRYPSLPRSVRGGV